MSKGMTVLCMKSMVRLFFCVKICCLFLRFCYTIGRDTHLKNGIEEELKDGINENRGSI